MSYFRGELGERSEETTNLPEMFRMHRDKVEASLARGKAVANDHRADVSGYDPVRWTEFGGYAEGTLFNNDDEDS